MHDISVFLFWAMVIGIGGFVLFVFGCRVWFGLEEASLFRPGRNMYHRICKKCGSHQCVYQSCQGTWWARVYPLGNDENCKCHSFSEDREI